MEKYGRYMRNCRMCNSENLYPFLNLGFHPPSDAILSQNDLEEPEITFPLKVVQCQDCGLTQTSYVVNPKLLYGYKYKYESSMTETGKSHFFNMADSISSKFVFKENPLVVDIGSNVGVLLEGFERNGARVLGIDPAPEICKKANERGIETWQEFINSKVASRIVNKKGKAKIVTGTNVFAHIDDKKEFMNSLDVMLDDEGIFVFEAPYLVDLIDNMEYDTIYLEHLEYISVKPLIGFFKKYGMDIFDIEKYDIHGKSLRFFSCRENRIPISDTTTKYLNLEDEKKIYKKETLDDFAQKVKDHRNELVNLLRDLKKEGNKIVGISAPAKGNTILNYCKIGTDLIDYITEKSDIKQRHYTPGMHIPIIGEDQLLKDRPDYGVVFAWNFANEIIKNNKEFAERGGKFIIPIPSPIIK
jgi:SAM-dependent methyltransferase